MNIQRELALSLIKCEDDRIMGDAMPLSSALAVSADLMRAYAKQYETGYMKEHCLHYLTPADFAGKHFGGSR